MSEIGQGTLNTILQGQGTVSPKFSSATYPASTTINQILYSSSANSVTGLSTANNGTLITDATGVPSFLANGVTGQILTATTGSPPSWASPATSGTVTSVSGTANQVSVATGTTTPVISLTGPYTPATYTAHGVLIGEGTSSIVALSAGSAGQVLQSGGAGADPSYSTATYPSTAGTSGNVLTSNGTNWTSVAPISNVAITSFTPVLNFGGATTGIAYTTQTGRYIRIGSFVFFEIAITLSSKGSATGAATITGLPLTSNASSLRSVVTFVFNFSFNAYPTSTVSVFGYINNNSTVINIAANASGVNAANVTDTTFQNGSDFTITGSYMV